MIFNDAFLFSCFPLDAFAYLFRPKIRTLVAEDDFFMRPLLTRILYAVDQGMDITWVSSLEDSKIALQKTNYDLVIADYLLEGSGTGLDLWDYCRACHPKLPVLIISGTSLDTIKKSAGCENAKINYLNKPFRAEQCHYWIERLI